MKYDLEAFEDLVRHGYLKKATKGDLVLYGYTDQTTFERAWQTPYTLHARGIIFDSKTGQLVAKPFPKFFNLGEMENMSISNLPKEPYKVYEKADGSLGIIFHYQGQWHMATRGSFQSEQAIRGMEILKKKYNMAWLYPGFTYLVEIIYPDNKIIIDYKGEEKLVLLGVYHTESQQEVVWDGQYGQSGSWGRFQSTGMELPKQYNYTIEEMIELKKSLPKDDEGFVVRFESGLRVKIKGDEYMRIAKMISQMSPLSFWEAMKDGRVGREYVMQLPEEFRKEYEPMIEKLEQQYTQVMQEIEGDRKHLPAGDLLSKEGQKTLGLLVQGKNDFKHPTAMFSLIKHQVPALQKYVMKLIRPTGNAFVGLDEKQG
jgi:RNA ligase